MRIVAFCATLLTLSFGASLTAAEADKPVPTKEAAGKMTVPEGFKVTLFAGEPDIVQPIAFCFDDRGRMWVVECLSYPKWSKDGKGGDRVVILEDTDGDGVHDKKTVFMDNGVNLSGIEIGFGGIWLCSTPNLVFVPILEGDKPGKPVVMLNGWNLNEAKHNIFNSLVWGPDGWLYGCNGIQSKAWVGEPNAPKHQRTYLDCGVWKYHPKYRLFEVVAHGTTNPFGLDFDDHGELFITNCVIDHLFNFVPGGHYQRMYGQDANPFSYGLMKSCVDYKHWAGGDWTTSRTTGVGGKPEHSDFGGGHAHSGAAIYLGDNFPKEYRNTLFTCNIHGNRLNNDGLERTKSGMKGVRRPDFLFANDSWFRGICVKVGPEGALYVSDWCDTGECHNYDKADTTNGRIYRVVYKDAKQFKGDVSKMTDAELVKLQTSPNEWLVRKARLELQERIAAKATFEKNTRQALADIVADRTIPTTHRLRAFWTLDAAQWLNQQIVYELAQDQDEALRVWAYRAMFRFGGKFRDLNPVEQNKVGEWIAAEKSEYVRLGIASAMREPTNRHFSTVVYEWEKISKNIIPPLVENPHPIEDPNHALMLWYTLQGYFAAYPEDALPMLPKIRVPLIRQNTVRYLLSRPDDTLPKLLTELGKIDSEVVRLDILRGITESLAGKKDITAPKEWADVYAKLLKSDSPQVTREAEAVAVIFGDKDAIASLLKRITDTKAKIEDRRTAIALLSSRKLPDFAKTLHTLLDEPAMRGVAIRALASSSDANTPAAIIKVYPKLTAVEKADAVQTLSARVSYAKELLEAIEKGTIPRADVPVVTARQILALNDKPTSERLEKVWGKVTVASKERAALIKKWKEILTEDTIKKADAANGRVLFTKNCAACHKMFGEGQSVGPELTGSQRSSLDYVLENVLDPSAVVPREFQMTNFTLADERVVGGIIVRETKDAATVRTINDTLTIPTADIVTRKQTALSIMPDGLFDAMKPEEVRDLIAYLRVKEQVPPK